MSWHVEGISCEDIWKHFGQHVSEEMGHKDEKMNSEFGNEGGEILLPHRPHGVNFSDSISIRLSNLPPQVQLDIALCKRLKHTDAYASPGLELPVISHLESLEQSHYANF